MRKITLFFVILIGFVIQTVKAQTPEGFNYQAVLRDNSGELIVNQSVQVRISILNESSGGATVYSEIHTLNTGANGEINLKIGTQTPETGVFADINWGTDLKFMKVEVDEGSGYTDMGTIQLLSVPYALYAKSASKAEVLGQSNVYSTQSDTLFVVKDHEGNVVFAVFPDGAQLIVSQESKGRVGGFAVSGRSPAKDIVNDYFIVTPDSTRIYVNDTSALKGRVGGFAVSGRSPAKGTVNDYLFVTNDSTRIYVNESVTKGRVGGFAVSGRSPGKGILNDYLVVTTDSTRVYVNDTTQTKGRVGGFAVSGRSPGKGIINDYLQVTRDSTRVFISESTKGRVGGFAVSGRSPGKLGEKNDYFNISANTIAEKVLNESRVMWYPEKSAFLSGEVHVGAVDSVGENSTAMGYRSIAMGHQSQAFGYKSIAYGTYSTAIGYESESDTNSMAVGYQAKATGNDAFAMGSGALAVADKSFAFGSVGIDSLGNVTGNTKAIGEYSYAFGLGSVSSGRGAFAMGANDTASGVFATAIGYKTKASEWYTTSMGGYTKATADFATALGYKSEATNVGATSIGHIAKASGRYSVAMGKSTKSVGDYSFAANQYTNANGYASASFGGHTTAGGQYALALGYSTSAGGQYSIAGGYSSSAPAQFAIALGDQNTSSGIGSFSMGVGNAASGKYSMALGEHNYAKSYTCFSIGQYNVDNGTHPTDWEGTDPLFIAGNGALGWEANALVLTKYGNLWIAGNLTEASDKRLKENIVNIENILDKINQINPVYFEFKNKRSFPGGTQIGLIAQEIEPLFPELVSTDASGYLSVDYSKMSAILVQAIKEQQQIIENQEKENIELQNQINEINQKLKILEELINKK